MGILARVAEHLFASLPNRCLLCHQTVERHSQGVCGYCLRSCLYRAGACLGCGKGMISEQMYCGSCMKQEPIKIVAPCSYHSLLGPLIAELKYRQQFAIVPPLVSALCDRVEELGSMAFLRMPQALVPVPLHLNRLKSRGLNQAWVIADEIGKTLNLPAESGYVKRLLDTSPQAGLSGSKRRKNLRGAFMLEAGFPYQRIALVDDVVTTGTTVSEIAQLFSQQNVDVQVWCLARAEAPYLKLD